MPDDRIAFHVESDARPSGFGSTADCRDPVERATIHTVGYSHKTAPVAFGGNSLRRQCVLRVMSGNIRIIRRARPFISSMYLYDIASHH